MRARPRVLPIAPALLLPALVALALIGGACSGDTTTSTRATATSKSTTSMTATGLSLTSTTSPTSTATAPTAVPTHLQLVAKGFDEPTTIIASPDGTGLWIAERFGKVWAVSAGGGHRTLVLDVSDRVRTGYQEQGLLGIAVSPGTGSSGDRNVVVDYVKDTGDHGTTVISRFPLSSTGALPIDNDSERVLFSVKQPFDNHNGGQVLFGPDDKLYVGLGDGGGQGDPSGNGQSTSVALGKILRLEPDTGAAVTDNPFVAVKGAEPRIWLYGTRNPWRFSFDRDGGLWIGDVGGSAFEEVDHLPPGTARGANLGWQLREGATDSDTDGDRSHLVDPIASFSHDGGWCSIIGGTRDATGTGLASGTYVFGDFCLPHLWSIDPNGTSVELPGTDIEKLTTLGTGPNGGLYAGNLDGNIYRVVGS